MNPKRFLWWILVGISINRVCSIIPADWYFEDPFLLYDMGRPIQVQAYVYFITTGHLPFIATWYGFYSLRSDYSPIFYKFIAIELFYLADYILIYEHPWFHLGNYGVEFTDARILLYAISIGTWKTTGNIGR